MLRTPCYAGCSLCLPLALLVEQSGTRQGSRTPNLLIRSQVHYPIMLQVLLLKNVNFFETVANLGNYIPL